MTTQGRHGLDAMGTRADEARTGWQAARLAERADAFDRRAAPSYYLFEQERLLGMVGLLPLWRRGQVTLSYCLRSTAQRKGYGAEAVAATAVFTVRALDARLITTCHAEPKTASARLARRLGVQQVARHPLACEMPDGTLVAGIGHALEDVGHLNGRAVSWG